DVSSFSHLCRRFGALKYLLMCCTEEKKLAGLSKSECEALMQETSAYCEALHKNGHLIVAEALEPVEMATTVRVRNGTLSTTDGPFAETKEQFGGFFLINARDLNEAIQVASKFPSVRVGSMEVRPVRELDR
ncbi:MAG TPA: YciI family protein, partial [Nitrospiraceae bacterium]|nr:YciI family protein [Nitrospiraceae bacterium]